MKCVDIKCDFHKVVGKIKPMHGVGQPPFIGVSDRYMHYLKEANIPYSRLHDVGGPYGGHVYVDIPNIFRDFNADVENPDSYDFAFTDVLITALMKQDCEPIYRLGVTIENYHNIKAYYIAPPADFHKWARICEHIVRHYTEGWAEGFYYPITYWEIWNEPENGESIETNQMWSGTDEEYFELYDIASTHLKKCFGEKIRIGGYGASGFYEVVADPESIGMSVAWRKHCMEFSRDFLAYIKEHNSPMDFFSWHCYGSVEDAMAMADYVEKMLIEYGYAEAETMLNEWNNTVGMETLGTSLASARAAAMMCAMQNKKTDILCYYDARIRSGAYGGLFNSITRKPYCTYYSFVCFGEMHALGKQIELNLGEKDVYAVAATDGEKKAVLIANISGQAVKLKTNLSNDMKVYLIDAEHHYELLDQENADELTIQDNQVYFIKNYEEGI